MKIRCDFVSNSSSSSFIVISDSGEYEKAKKESYELELPCAQGEKEFGWQTEQYYDLYSKLNWCAVVIQSKIDMEKYESSKNCLSEQVGKLWFRSESMIELLKEVCLKKLNMKISFRKRSENEYESDYGYIDHQSDIGESPENARMFETPQKLYDFIANNNSYIDNSNDNGGRDDWYDPVSDTRKSQPKDYSI